MRVLMGLGSLLLMGALVVAVIAWLSTRHQVIVRILGIALAAVVATYCAVVVFALVADNVGVWPRLPGVLSVISFAVIGAAAVATAMRGHRRA